MSRVARSAVLFAPVLVVAGLLGAQSTGPAAAGRRAADDPPGALLVLPARELVLTADAPGAPPVIGPGTPRTAQLTLVNTTGQPVPVEVTAALAGAGEDRVVSLQARGVTQAGRLTLTVPPAATQVVTLTSTGAAGTGALAVRSVPQGGPATLVRRVVTVAASPVPLVTAVRADSRTLWTGPSSDGAPATLTLPARGQCPENWSGPPLPLTAGERVVVGVVRCGPGVVTLEVPGAPPGSYTGRIDLSAAGGQPGAAPGGAVTVTVVRAAGWLWPLGLGALGVLVALLQRWYRRRAARVLRLSRRVDGLASRAGAAEVEVREHPVTPPSSGLFRYSVDPAFRGQLSALRGRLRRALVDGDPRAAGTVEVRIDELETSLERWRAQAPAAFRDLGEAARAAQAAYPPPPAAGTAAAGKASAAVGATAVAGQPAARLRAHAQELFALDGDPVPVHDLAALLDEIAATTAALRLLPGLAALRARLEELPAARDVDLARGLLARVEADLGAAGSGREALAQEPAQALRRAAELLGRLPGGAVPGWAGAAGTTVAGATAATSTATGTVAAPAPATAPGTAGTVASAGTVAAAPGGAPGRSAGSLPLLLTVAAAALWGGLLLWYVGRPWGTPVDLVSAVAWGYGSTLVAGVALDAADRLARRPAPTG